MIISGIQYWQLR